MPLERDLLPDQKDLEDAKISWRDARIAFENTNLQKKGIIQALQEKKFIRADQFLNELLDFHAKHGGAEFAVKTLCDLAKEAQTMGLQDWDLDLTRMAVETNPEDPWAWSQRGDALARAFLWKEASDALRHAVQLNPFDVRSSNYLAKSLSELGQLHDALATYNWVVENHPEDVVAHCGRANVLKDMNRLAEALAAYDWVVENHPEVVVARNGRAEVLKDMNRLAEALAAYDWVVENHPEDVVARNGRAGVLKNLNRLTEALAAYEKVLTSHPGDPYAKTGRGGVLLLLGRWEEALAQLRLSSDHQTKSDWAAHYLCGVVHLRMGDLETASRIFSEGVAGGLPIGYRLFSIWSGSDSVAAKPF